MTSSKILLSSLEDDTGILNVLEIGTNFPFTVKRIFTISPNSPEVTRGDHAHFECKQFILAVTGSCNLKTISKTEESEYFLQPGEFGVFVEPITWISLNNFAKNSCILVLASHAYDPEDYISDLGKILYGTVKKPH